MEGNWGRIKDILITLWFCFSCLFGFLFVAVVCPFFFFLFPHTLVFEVQGILLLEVALWPTFSNLTLLRIWSLFLGVFKRPFFFFFLAAKRGKRKLWQIRSQVGTQFSYVLWSCQFVRFVKQLGFKSKGLWRMVYLASPSHAFFFFWFFFFTLFRVWVFNHYFEQIYFTFFHLHFRRRTRS